MRTLEDLRAAAGVLPDADWDRFVASTHIDREAWHDGNGYDLQCLASLTSEQRELVRQWLTGRLQPTRATLEWRDMEAAAALGAADLLNTLYGHADPDIRLRVARLLGHAEAFEEEVCVILRESRDASCVSRALDAVVESATENVRTALIERVQKLDENFVPAAMALLEVFGGVEDAWNERPFLFQVQSQGLRGELMKELLARAGGASTSRG